MKNNIKNILLLVVASSLIMSGCQKDFQAINDDPISIKNPEPAKLLAPSLVGSLSLGMFRNRNFNNELMQVTVNISDGDATVFRYSYRKTTGDYLWNGWYSQLTNLKDIHKRASNPATLNTSYQGISLVMQAWVYANLTDTYGDIPFTESVQGVDGKLEPKFDTQKDVYLGVFKMLEDANTLLTANTAIVPISDPVYNGDIAKWRKFCNSLYLRLLLRVSGKSDVSTQVVAKMKEIVVTNTGKYPIMTSNAESATILWNGGTNTSDPYTSPYVNGIRAQDFRQPGIGSFFIDRLFSWKDPRIDISSSKGYAFKTVNGSSTVYTNRWAISQGSLGFSGVPSGYSIGQGIIKQSYFYSFDQTLSGSVLYNDKSLQANPLTGIFMNFAELQFILAEAVVKNYISGSAETYYNNGIAASINYWVPSFSTNIASTEFLDYVTDADIVWGTYNVNSDEDKMEQIHMQKYYALFLVDMQQWFEYRRTGHPYLPQGPGLANGGVMPARIAYPIYVQTTNPTSYKAAVASMGPDEIFTQVWWQKP